MQSKDSLRIFFLEKRKKLSRSDVLEKSRKIWERLRGLKEFLEARTVLFYYSIKNEVKTDFMIKEILGSKKVALPSIRGNSIVPLEVNDLEYMRKGKFGIPEPIGNEVPLDMIDIVIVPGIAFDFEGYRIGYGKGYYDNFLRKITCRKVGLAYDFQVVEELPRGWCDVPVDIIVTEKRIIKCYEWRKEKEILAEIKLLIDKYGVASKNDVECSEEMLNNLANKKLIKIEGDNLYLTDKGRKAIKIVLVGGCFNLLHPGHILFLKEAKKLGDLLYVIVARDEEISKKGQPVIFNQRQRMQMIDAIKYVDLVIAGKEDKKEVIKRIKPDIIAIGYDQKITFNMDEELGKVRIIRIKRKIDGLSTSKIIEKIKREGNKGNLQKNQ